MMMIDDDGLSHVREILWLQKQNVLKAIYPSCVQDHNTEIQLSQTSNNNKLSCHRDRATLHVIQYFTKSLKVIDGHSKWHPWAERVSPY